MKHYGTNQTTTKPVIYISSNGRKWTLWDYSTITLANVGDKVYMYGDNPSGVGRSRNNNSAFVMTGRISASGDATTLIANEGTDTLTSYALTYLFDGCTSLTAAPELPATTLAEGCYQGMFNGCTSLTAAPELPATTMDYTCYGNIFKGCISLTAAPELPATTLAQSCYQSMFEGCTSLTTAPDIKGETMAYNSLYYMFYGCSLIDSVKIHVINWSTSYARNWMYNVGPSGTIYAPTGSDIANYSGNSGVPSGWTVEYF